MQATKSVNSRDLKEKDWFAKPHYCHNSWGGRCRIRGQTLGFESGITWMWMEENVCHTFLLTFIPSHQIIEQCNDQILPDCDWKRTRISFDARHATVVRLLPDHRRRCNWSSVFLKLKWWTKWLFMWVRSKWQLITKLASNPEKRLSPPPSPSCQMRL